MLVMREMFPPIEVVLFEREYSLHKFCKYLGPPAFGPVPDLP
jgi:hypothetical protein